MKRTTTALLLSLTVHLAGLMTIYIWMDEKQTPKSERVSLRMTAVNVHQDEPKDRAPQEVIKNVKQEPSKPLKETKPLPKKRDKIASTTPTPSLVQDVREVPETNATSFAEEKPQKASTVEISEMEPEKQTYVALYGDVIRQMIEKNKEYPEIARKRSLSDNVEVSFTLTTQGEIEELRASSKYKILSNSAIETIHKAKVFFPRPTENVTIKIPIIYVIK